MLNYVTWHSETSVIGNILDEIVIMIYIRDEEGNK